jgi:hypothetical protein
MVRLINMVHQLLTPAQVAGFATQDRKIAASGTVRRINLVLAVREPQDTTTILVEMKNRVNGMVRLRMPLPNNIEAPLVVHLNNQVAMISQTTLVPLSVGLRDAPVEWLLEMTNKVNTQREIAATKVHYVFL